MKDREIARPMVALSLSPHTLQAIGDQMHVAKRFTNAINRGDHGDAKK